MQRNDYRRALIMLRATRPGLSGHVRLERRTLMGSLQITVSGAANDMKMDAALLGRHTGRMVAATIGSLRHDGRGQAGMTWNFDPRNIEGRELEKYDLIAILSPHDFGAPEIALFGYVNGSKEIDWVEVQSAANALYPGGEPVLSLPPPEAQVVDGGFDEQAVPAMASIDETAELELIAEPVTAEFEEPLQEVIPVMAAVLPADAAPPDESSLLGFPIEESVPVAAQRVHLNTQNPWPEPVEPLRALFDGDWIEAPFDAPGYVFARAPMAAEGGMSYCAIGVRPDMGLPQTVCYAIPSTFSIEPPPGMEGYSWQGGAREGFWVIWQDVNTGEAVEAG